MSHVLGIFEGIPSSILGNRNGPSGKHENLKSLQFIWFKFQFYGASQIFGRFLVMFLVFFLFNPSISFSFFPGLWWTQHVFWFATFSGHKKQTSLRQPLG